MMFDHIANRYDFLNHFLSLGIDIFWRKKAVKMLKNSNVRTLLDVATGTGDFAIEAMQLNPDTITGIDISEGMLAIGKDKIIKKGLSDKINLMKVDSEEMPFEDNRFDAITVGFGVRNFENLQQGLYEMNRVLKQDGTLLILEFSKPVIFPFKQIFNVYFLKILPLLGRIISRDPSAYTYLPESINAFPDGNEFLEELRKAGFRELCVKRLTFGIASIYTGIK
jgi:demethylmenaquinone methyltransferase / 2-methoxy-6-polyprenyl-1,4-benzoquinol methylase